MTWIVGSAPPFGYSVLVSDTCVTFSNKYGNPSYLNCLQKIYPIGPSILGGFAGSVKIGFQLLSQLHSELSVVPKNKGWSLDVISQTWWPRVARRVYTKSENAEQKLGAQIILAGVHPNLRRGDAPWSATDIYTFRSPKFQPQKAKFNEAVSIGCGGGIIKLKNILENLSNDFNLFKLAVGHNGPEKLARMLAHILSLELMDNPVSGISDNFQVGIAFQKNFIIKSHEFSIVNENGEKIEKKAPYIATSYEEFTNIVKKAGFAHTRACC